MPNGLHAILLAKGPIVRLDMSGFETSYDPLPLYRQPRRTRLGAACANHNYAVP